jgi:hypothetical protein
LIKFGPFLAAVLSLAPSLPAQGQTVGAIPSTIKKTVEFEDRGRVYSVDVDSGRVTFVESGDVQPIPPDPTPVPPVVVKPAIIRLFVAPYSVEQHAWKTDPRIRDAAAKMGVQFRAYDSTEKDADSLGLRQLLRQNEVPCVVIQGDDGKVITARKVTGPDDVVKALESVN